MCFCLVVWAGFFLVLLVPIAAVTSRPRETSGNRFLDELLFLFGYPPGSGGALLCGTLPLRYCTSRFAHKVKGEKKKRREEGSGGGVAEEEEEEEEEETSSRWRPAPGCSRQGYCASSPCSSGVCGKQVLQALVDMITGQRGDG